MKLFTAMLGTETNTFSPFLTGFANFEQTYLVRGGRHGAAPYSDAEPYSEAVPLIRWRELAQARGWSTVESLATYAGPAGLTLRHASLQKWVYFLQKAPARLCRPSRVWASANTAEAKGARSETIPLPDSDR